MAKTLKELQAENEALKLQVASQPKNSHIFNEMDAISKNSFVGSDQIKVKPIHDHKNVSLYHTNGVHIGKRVGALHPHNAKVELERFGRRGIVLSVSKPTEEQIAKYKETEEYKLAKKKYDAFRKGKIKKRRNQSIDDLAAAISKMSGKKVVNAIAEQPV